MRNGLPRSGPDIDTDVVAIGLIRFLDVGFCDLERFGEGSLFIVRSFEPGSDVSSGNKEQMAGTDGEPIPQCNNVCRTGRVLEEDPFAFELAERARHLGGRVIKVARLDRYSFEKM